MTEDVLLVERRPPVCLLTLNRPRMSNSLNVQLLQALEQAVAEARYAENLRVIVITGAGTKAFCSGADLKERLSMSEGDVRHFLFVIRRLFNDLDNPVLSLVSSLIFRAKRLYWMAFL